MKYNYFYSILFTLIILGMMSCTDSKDTHGGDNVEIDETTAFSLNKPVLYKGTPVYEAAIAIAEDNHNALRKWAANASKELLNYQDAKQANIPLNLYAHRRGNMEAVKILTEAGANPNLQSDAGISAFLASCSVTHNAKDNSMMIYLLANGGNPNAESSRITHRTPLIMASRTNLENVKILVEAGANVNYVLKHPDGTVESPLSKALTTRRIHVVNYYIFEQEVDYRSINKPSIKEGIPPKTILTDLRRMTFDLGTEEHQAKWKLINYLKKQGLNYSQQPIPKYILKQYDKDYLSKY